MKEEWFEKVVEYQQRDWAKGNVDLSHLWVFLISSGITCFFIFMILGTKIAEAVSFLFTLFVFVLMLKTSQKKKIYYRRIK